jgi:hypothetical protein
MCDLELLWDSVGLLEDHWRYYNDGQASCQGLDVLYARKEVAYALSQLSKLDHLTHDMEISIVEHDMVSSWT